MLNFVTSVFVLNTYLLLLCFLRADFVAEVVGKPKVLFNPAEMTLVFPQSSVLDKR